MNQHRGPLDWVALQEGSKASESTTIELAKGDNYDETDLSDESSKPLSKPIDTTPAMSGAAGFGYANTIWVGPQDRGDGQQDPTDNGMIRVVCLKDLLLVRHGSDTKSVDRIKADGGAVCGCSRSWRHGLR